MQVLYGEEVLRRLALDAGAQPELWGPDVVRWYRRRLQSLAAARDREDLQRLKALDLRPECGRGAAHYTMRLDGRFRLLIDFDLAKTDQVTVVGIVRSDQREAVL